MNSQFNEIKQSKSANIPDLPRGEASNSRRKWPENKMKHLVIFKYGNNGIVKFSTKLPTLPLINK